MSGRRLTAAAKAARDREIVADRVRGKQWPTISEKYGLSTRQCQAIYAQFRDTEFPDESPDLLETLRDEILLISSVIEDCQLLAETTENDSVHLGALKAKMDAIARRVELKQVSGLLPGRLESVELATQGLRWIDALREAAFQLQLELPPDIAERLLSAWQEIYDGPRHAKIVKARKVQKTENEFNQVRRNLQLQANAYRRRAASGEDLAK
jgi:hypothetical protein